MLLPLQPLQPTNSQPMTTGDAMRRIVYLVLKPIVMNLLLIGALTLTACNPTSPTVIAPSGDNPATVLAWNKSADAVVFRLDRQVLNEPDYEARNRLPPCTIYGDGRVVWVNALRPNGEEVLEALIDDVQFRSFLEYAIRDLKFYEVPDYASLELPPEQNAGVESITLHLSEQVRTVRTYRLWPSGIYPLLLERCWALSDSPVRVIPDAGWVTVYAGPEATMLPTLDWPPSAPFRLEEAFAKQQSMWVEGVALRQLWITQRSTQGKILWRDGSKLYWVAIQVPGISRDALPPPPATPTPQP
jgi:hypothetical protein